MLNLEVQLPFSWKEAETGWDDGNICYSDHLFSQNLALSGTQTAATGRSCSQSDAGGTSRNRQHPILGNPGFLVDLYWVMSLVWVACSVPSRLGSTERFRNWGRQLSASMMDSLGETIYTRVTGSAQLRSIPATSLPENYVFAWKASNPLFKSFWHAGKRAVK